MRATVAAILAVMAIAAAACSPNPTTAGVPEPGSSASAPHAPCDQPLCLEQTVDMLEALDRPLDENVLKIFSTASDSARNLVYVSGIMSSDIAVLDAATGEWIRTVDSGGEGRGLKYLYLDESRNRLFVLDATNATLRRVDLSTGAIEGPVALSGFLEGHQAVVDTSRGNLLIATKDAGIQAFGGPTFGLFYQQTALGERTGEMVYDPARDAVYVLDSATTGESRTISILDPASGAVEGKIAFTMPANERTGWLMFDADGDRFLVGSARAVTVLSRDGRTLKTIRLAGNRTVSDMLFDAAHGKVAVLSTERPAEGEAAGVGGHLDVYDVETGRSAASLSFGRKPHRMSLNNANGRIYIANGDASVVWSIDTATYRAAEPIRLGDSVEQVAVAADGTAYLSSRLGGSYLAAFDPGTSAVETFTAGTWPIPVQATAGGTRLLVLNAWDSSLSVFDVTGGQALLATIPLDLPNGTTDRLPAMAIDSSRSLAYIGYPEFAKVVVVDFQAMNVVATIAINGVKTGDTGGGPGQIQLEVDESRNRLFVLSLQQQEVTVYDAATGYTKVATLSREAIDWKKVPREGELLFFDQARDVLFIGSVEVDAATLLPTGRSLAGAMAIFGADAESETYWGLRAGQPGWLVTISNAATLETLHEEPLPGAHVLLPVPALDAAHGRLYVGHQAEAQLDVFVVGDLR